MERHKAAAIHYPDLSSSEQAALLAFFDEQSDKIKDRFALGPIAFQHQSGKSIAFFTYRDFLDYVSHLRANARRLPA
jgi:hypothetical protein